MRVEVVPCAAAHGEFIADNLRQADERERAALWRVSSRAAMRISLARSDEAWAGLVDGVPACAFGVGPRVLLEGGGTPWLIGTDALDRPAIGLAFLRRNRDVVARWRARYAFLENAVDARHTVAIRWLRWLGFELGPALPVGLNGEAFHLIRMEGAGAVLEAA